MKKPEKIDDKELIKLIRKKIEAKDYFITEHARKRVIERDVIESHILHILLGDSGYYSRRVRKRDKYDSKKGEHWSYCFKGYVATNERYLRVIVSFEDNLMPIITVVWDGED